MVARYVGVLLLVILTLVAAELAIKVIFPLLPFIILIGVLYLVLAGRFKKKRKF